MGMVDPQDMTKRWVPSQAQIDIAHVLLNAGYGTKPEGAQGLFTPHLLVNKTFGMWSPEVQVVHLDGVFLEMQACWDYLRKVAEKRHDEDGQTVMGGWTIHVQSHAPTLIDQMWAVFDDIGSQFPEL